MKITPYSTNSGILFLFLLDNDVVFASSDMEIMYSHIFNGDNELFIGREISIDDNTYSITKIYGQSDLQGRGSYEEMMTGNKYQFSYIMMIDLIQA